MKSIEQYIREKLGRPDAPAEVDADDLWAGIAQELGPGHKPAAAPWPWRTLFFSLLFFVIGGLTTWTLLQDRETEGETELAVTKSDEAANNETTSPSAPAAIMEPPASPQQDGAPRASSPNERQDVSITAAAESDASVRDQAPKGTSPAPAAAPAKSLSPTQNSTQEIAPTGTRTAPALAQMENSTVNTPPAANELILEQQSELTSARSLSAISALPSLPTSALTVKPTAFSLPAATPAKPFKSTLSKRFSVGLSAGTNLLLTRYATPAEGPDALNAAVKPAAGGSFGFDLRYRLNKHLALSTGLEYHRTLNTFEHTVQRDTTIEHPSAFNSGPVDAIFSRRVADNLRTRFISVPVLLHWQKRRGNFLLGVGTGIGLNFRQFATGTTLTPNGAFAPFDAATGPAPTPEFFLSYHLSTTLAYRLKPQSPLSLEAKADFRYLPFGADELSGVKRSSLLAGFSVGLRFGL